MKQKIFFVLPTLVGGGAEKFVIQLANAFADKGLDVFLVILTNESDDYLEEISSTVPLIRLNQKNSFGSLLALIFLFKQQKPDIIFSTITHINVLCLIAKSLSGIKGKVFLRNTTVFSKFNSPKNILTKIFAKLIYPFASGIISPSQDVYEDNIKLGIKNKNMTVIYNFVNKKKLQELTEKPDEPSEKFDYPLILAVGRLTDKKNYAYLIRSFAKLCNQYDYPDAKLIILGKGPDQFNLEHLIKELNLQNKVILKGFLKNPYPYFAKADLFVHPSKVEGLANVLLAALALECNIVTTDCPGSREVLNNGTYGRIIPITDDTQILVNAMHEALQQPIDKSILIASIKSHDVTTVVQQYLDFIGVS
jgi:glycosyltransferase involved in cell wall biosynthesis